MSAALDHHEQSQQPTEPTTRGPTREDDSPGRRAVVRAGRRAARALAIARKLADRHGEEI
jgi:hypothetical protein